MQWWGVLREGDAAEKEGAAEKGTQLCWGAAHQQDATHDVPAIPPHPQVPSPSRAPRLPAAAVFMAAHKQSPPSLSPFLIT